MSTKGILVDYEYCSGCQTCEMACQVEKDLAKGHNGVVVQTVGPWTIDKATDTYQYDNLPVFTDECDLCAERVLAGKQPTCVKHCMAAVLTYGDVEELAPKLAEKSKQVLFVPKSGKEQ